MRGGKPLLPSEKAARGTYQPSRDAGVIEVVSPNAPPQMPGNLPPEVIEVWQEELPRVMQAGMVTELDSRFFTRYCRLAAALDSIAHPQVGPSAHYVELRRMEEVLGIAGRKSRVIREKKSDRPASGFARFVKRPGT